MVHVMSTLLLIADGKGLNGEASGLLISGSISAYRGAAPQFSHDSQGGTRLSHETDKAWHFAGPEAAVRQPAGCLESGQAE